MSRIRTTKPEFWSSEQVMRLPRDARLLFIGIWNFADDAGRFRWSAHTLKAQIFPGDFDVTEEMMEDWLSLIAQNELIEQYVNDGKSYGFVVGWHHQKINRPQPPKHPEPPTKQPIPGSRRDHSLNAHGLDTDGRDLKGSEGKGEEGRGERAGAPPPPIALPIPANQQAAQLHALQARGVPSAHVEELKGIIAAQADRMGFERPPRASDKHYRDAAEDCAKAARKRGGNCLEIVMTELAQAALAAHRDGKQFGFALQDAGLGKPTSLAQASPRETVAALRAEIGKAALANDIDRCHTLTRQLDAAERQLPENQPKWGNHGR